jgi:hypothetical protein
MHTVRRPHGILWEGRSLLDDGPIVAIVTSGTTNEKTGPMSQVWILRQDVAPHVAKRNGDDFSVCGHCPMHAGCYVRTFQAPRNVWESYRAGSYRAVPIEAFERFAIRWGAYGDPALLPPSLVLAANAKGRGWTGYTHQHQHAWAQWCKGVFMASCESPAQERKLRALGWGTFRVGKRDGSDQGRAELCAHEATGVTCIECRACDGGPRAIFVSAHGALAKQVPAERLARRRESG